MTNTRYTVKVYTRKGEFYASESFGRESSALGRALAWTSTKGQKAWTAHVWHGDTRIASYRNGRQFVPRERPVPTVAPPAQPSALERVKDALRCLEADRGDDGVVMMEVRTLRSALASLVSEVRAEERRACIADAAQQCVCATVSGGCGCSACRTAERIRTRR